MNRFRRTILIALSALVLISPGWFDGKSHGESPAEDRVARIGILARRGVEECIRSWTPTAQYLAERIPGTRFEIVPLTFEAISAAVATRQVEFLIANSSIYVEMQALYGISRMATMRASRSPAYSAVFGGVVFCRADRDDIDTLEELRGKSFVAVDETSLGGWRAAWREIKRAGIDPYRDFSPLLFAGTHDEVVKAVLDRKVDAGTVSTSIIEAMIGEGLLAPGSLKVIHEQRIGEFPYRLSTRLYPEWPFAKLKHTPNALAERVCVALLGMDRDCMPARAANCQGWTIPLDYGSVEECLKELRIGIYEDYGKATLTDILQSYRWWVAGGMALLVLLIVVVIRSLHLNRKLLQSKATMEMEIAERKRTEQALRESERKHQELYGLLRLIGDNVPDLIWAKDMDGRFLFVNQAMCDKLLMCATPDEAVGNDDHFFSERERNAAYVHTFGQLCVDSDSIVKETMAPARFLEQGMVRSEPLILDVHKAPLLHESGRMIGTVGCGRDVTKEKEIEKALRESELYSRTILESIQAGVLVIDADTHTIVDANPMAALMIGTSKENIVGRLCSDFICRDGVSSCPITGHGQTIDSSEWTLLAADGRKIEILRTVAPITLESRVLLLENFVSISEQKRTEKELRESEARIRALFDATTDSAILMDTGGKVLALNYVAAQRRGRSPDEMVGKSIYAFLPPEAADLRKAEIEKVIRNGESVSFSEDREGRSFMLRIFPIFDTGAQVVQLASFSRDITEQKEAERERYERQQLFKTLAENAPMGISLMRTDFSFEYLNPGFSEMFGYTVEDLPDKPAWFDKAYPNPLKREERISQWKEHLRDRSSAGDSLEMTLRVRCKDGRDKIICLRSVIMDDGRQLVTYQDITEQRKLEAQVRQAQKLQAIGTLAGGIAHDFNNILMPIIGYTEMAMDDIANDSQLHRNLERVLQSGHRARELVRQILAFSRQSEEDKRPVRISLIVKEILHLLRAALPPNIEIRTSIAPEAATGTVLADPTQIHQIIMNLCTNAAHAMRGKGGLLEIGLAGVDHGIEDGGEWNPDLKPGRYLKLFVADTGHGMSRDILERIFDPYFTTKEQGEGTGLGLSVAYGIVHSHGGRIYAHSEPGNGSSFDVFLPRIEMAAEPGSGRSRRIPGGTGCILFVDDEAVIAEMAQQMLGNLGYRVVAETSSTEALETFRSSPERFDLLITDLAMPGMTGTELTKELHAVRPGLPVILCTGFSESLSRDNAAASGIREFVMKPIIRRELAEAIRRALEPAADTE